MVINLLPATVSSVSLLSFSSGSALIVGIASTDEILHMVRDVDWDEEDDIDRHPGKQPSAIRGYLMTTRCTGASAPSRPNFREMIQDAKKD